MIVKKNGVTKSIKLQNLDIIFKNEVILKDEVINDCKISSIYSQTKVWAGTAEITPRQPSQQDETTFNKKIEEEVICRKYQNGMMYCPGN